MNRYTVQPCQPNANRPRRLCRLALRSLPRLPKKTTFSNRQSPGDGGNGAIPTIQAADPAEKVTVMSAAVMPGEEARLRRRHVFAQASTAWSYCFMPTLRPARAREICRTLGVAVVTTLAHISATRTTFSTSAQQQAPGHPKLVRMPLEPRWSDPAQGEECLRRDGGGFAQVKVELPQTHYAAPISDISSCQLLELLGGFFRARTEDSKAVFRLAVGELTGKAAVSCRQVDVRSRFGVPLTAIITIWDKRTAAGR